MILVESDNGNDYKLSEHFHQVQRSCDKIGVPTLRVYGTPEHCKHEVDHVGGIATSSLQRAIAANHFFAEVADMVDYLQKNMTGQICCDGN